MGLLGGECCDREKKSMDIPATKIALSPSAPALDQSVASSLMLSMVWDMEGVALLKTQSFLCFHTIHGINRVAEARPLR